MTIPGEGSRPYFARPAWFYSIFPDSTWAKLKLRKSEYTESESEPVFRISTLFDQVVVQDRDGYHDDCPQ